MDDLTIIDSRGTGTVSCSPPGRVITRLVPARASVGLISRVAYISLDSCGLTTRSEGSVCTACSNAVAKAEIEGKRSSGFLANARKITVSMAADSWGLKMLGAGG